MKGTISERKMKPARVVTTNKHIIDGDDMKFAILIVAFLAYFGSSEHIKVHRVYPEALRVQDGAAAASTASTSAASNKVLSGVEDEDYDYDDEATPTTLRPTTAVKKANNRRKKLKGKYQI